MSECQSCVFYDGKARESDVNVLCRTGRRSDVCVRNRREAEAHTCFAAVAGGVRKE